LMFFNDPHFSRHPPECRADSYPIEILEKLHEIARLAVKLKVRVIGCSGDWFHRKGRVTWREGNDLLAVLRGWQDKDIDVVGILGNHDIAGHSMKREKLVVGLETRAVGSLVYSKTMDLLDHDPYLGEEDGSQVWVTGTSYFHGCDANDENRLKMYGAPPAPDKRCVRIHVCHGTLLQRGTFFEDYTVAPDLIDLLHEHDALPDVIVCGHLHFPEGIKFYLRPDGTGNVAVCRVGSLARVSSDDFDRIPKVLLVAIKGQRFVCKEIEVGTDVSRGGETPERNNPAEHAERIQEFVRVLREEADEWSLLDVRTVLTRVAEEMGHDDEALRVAVEAVEKRQ